MRRRKKRKTLTPTAAVLLLAVLAAVCGLIVFLVDRATPSREHEDLREYFGLEENEAALIFGQVTSGEKGRIENGSVYVDTDSVGRHISLSLFYDAKERCLYTTKEDSLTVLTADEAEKQGILIEHGGKAYLSTEYICETTGAEMEILSDPPRAAVKTYGVYEEAEVPKGTQIRTKASLKGRILEDVPEGGTVQILAKDGEGTETLRGKRGWTIAAGRQYAAGYVRTKDLAEIRTADAGRDPAKQPWSHRLSEDRVNLAFHQTDIPEANDSLAEILPEGAGITAVSPTWFFLQGTDGEISSFADPAYTAYAHERGVSVWPLLNDIDGAVNTAGLTAEFLSSGAARQRAAGMLVSELQRTGADGLNLDLEHVRQDAAPYFLEFIRELSVALRREGMVLSIDNYVPVYTRYLNRAEQARVADYVVCMCYDEHTAGSEKAGSVSSLPFLEKGVRDTLEEVPAEQLITAIPFYTRIWESRSAGAPDSRTAGMETAQEFVRENAMTVIWDEECAQHYTEQQIGDAFCQIWLEDAESLGRKMEVIRKYGTGVAEWKLGLETGDIWQVIAG